MKQTRKIARHSCDSHQVCDVLPFITVNNIKFDLDHYPIVVVVNNVCVHIHIDNMTNNDNYIVLLDLEI